jgi:transcriptional regulator GlxA family with amidase domain
MKKIALLVPEHAVLASIVDPRLVFTAINMFLAEAGQPPLFTVQLVGLTADVSLGEAAFTIHTDRQLPDPTPVDLVLIPALTGDLSAAIAANESFIPWIVGQYRQGADVASLCVGAFLLASTGLLNGKACSTHWAFADTFRTMFPAVALRDGAIVTEQSGLYSSGGAHSYWNLLLHLVEKYTDRDMAIRVANYFAIDIDRTSQLVFSLFRGQKQHDDEAVQQAQAFIETNLADKITVEQLADAFGVGRRSFERRFKKATRNTVIEYVQRVKIEAAKKSLETGTRNVGEVMYDVGYSDTKAFRALFRKITGLSPSDYRSKYNKTLIASPI